MVRIACQSRFTGSALTDASRSRPKTKAALPESGRHCEALLQTNMRA